MRVPQPLGQSSAAGVQAADRSRRRAGPHRVGEDDRVAPGPYIEQCGRVAIELARFDPRLRSESLQAAGDEQTGSVVAAQLVANADDENPPLVSHDRW